VLKSFTEKTEGSFIVEKKSYISWIYKKSDLYFGDIQANEIKTHLSSIFPELSIVNDYSSVTIKPANVNKAALVAAILKNEFQDSGNNSNNVVDLITVIGDDYTDEEVFNYLNSTKKFLINFNNNIKVLTATIGSKPSNAEYYFNEINDCIENIEAISQYETNRRIRSSMSCTTLNMFTDKLFTTTTNSNDNKYYSQEINSIFGGEFTEFTL
jgi:trehalose 6-phosphate synthase/phosphatase